VPRARHGAVRVKALVPDEVSGSHPAGAWLARDGVAVD
jgi:hypothetical protein